MQMKFYTEQLEVMLASNQSARSTALLSRYS